MTATRRLAAILAADVVGYSRLIGADEGGTLQALKAIRAELIDPTIAALRRGRRHGSVWGDKLGPDRLQCLESAAFVRADQS